MLCVFDLTRQDTAERIPAWLEECQRHMLAELDKEVKYLVLANKADLEHAFDANTLKALEERCKAVVPLAGFYMVSAKTGYNVQAVVDLIISLLYDTDTKPTLYSGNLYFPDRASWERMAEGLLFDRKREEKSRTMYDYCSVM